MKKKWIVLSSVTLLAALSMEVFPIQAQQIRIQEAVQQESLLTGGQQNLTGLVNSTVAPSTETNVSVSAAGLTVNGIFYPWDSSVQLADSQADASVVALYQYLRAVGKSDSTLFGHMEDTLLKAGSPALSESDVKDVTGSLAAINGLDCGALFEGYAQKYNDRHPWLSPLPDNNEGNIAAAALFFSVLSMKIPEAGSGGGRLSVLRKPIKQYLSTP